ncbi:MAG: hypothetical protein ACYTXT_19965 [Nostoc sp.]
MAYSSTIALLCLMQRCTKHLTPFGDRCAIATASNKNIPDLFNKSGM